MTDDLEHHHRVERLLPGAAGLARVEHARLELAPEHLEVHRRGQPLQRVPLRRELRQCLLPVEQPLLAGPLVFLVCHRRTVLYSQLVDSQYITLYASDCKALFN
jgi:hypothetical protein